MPTTNTSANQYNGAGMNTYNAFQPQLQSSLMQMAQNPLGSNQFQNQLVQQRASANQIGQRNQSNLLQNMRAGGGVLNNSGGFTAAALNRGSIGTSMMQGNAFNSAMNSALQSRSSALMAMQAYQPLQTGQTTSTSGLGTWLPQVASIGMNALMPGISGMASGNGFQSGYSGGSSNPYSAKTMQAAPIPQPSTSMFNSMQQQPYQ